MKLKILTIAALLIVWFGGFCAGVLYQMQMPPKLVWVYQRIPVPYENQTHIKYLSSLIDYYQDELNNRGKVMMRQEEELGILNFKVSWYKAMTGKEIEVRIER